jgi:NAD(P)-dependent dehydrogenase (short-subunit alcohol dehydrogenase family)
MQALAGKVAVITGASRGIGAAAARGFAAEGAHVVLAARSRSQLEQVARACEEHKVRALAVPTDVGEWGQVQALAHAVEKAFGRCDILLNNAGVGIGGSVADMPVEHLDETLRVNLRGPFLVAKAMAPLLRPGGTVLNVASVSGHEGRPGLAAYCMSKAGVRVFSQALGKELAARGIRSVAVCPGYVATEMVDDAPFPMRDMVQPDDLARVLVRLATQPESAYVDEIEVWPRRLYTE